MVTPHSHIYTQHPHIRAKRVWKVDAISNPTQVTRMWDDWARTNFIVPLCASDKEVYGHAKIFKRSIKFNLGWKVDVCVCAWSSCVLEFSSDLFIVSSNTFTKLWRCLRTCSVYVRIYPAPERNIESPITGIMVCLSKAKQFFLPSLSFFYIVLNVMMTI